MGTADFFETAFEKRNKAHGAGNNDGDFRERFAEKVKRFVSGHNFAEAFTPEHNAADCDGKSDTVKKRFERDRVAVKEEKRGLTVMRKQRICDRDKQKQRDIKSNVGKPFAAAGKSDRKEYCAAKRGNGQHGILQKRRDENDRKKV